jgi:hypothetical protein
VTFRTQAIADLPTFTNVDEFADSVDIDGVTVACVREGNGDTRATEDGVINQDTLLYVPLFDEDGAPTFEHVPKVHQRLTVDGEQAEVVGAKEEQGVLELRLRWFDS